MADLTILSPQPLTPLPLTSPSDVSARHAGRSGRGPISNQPASPLSTNGHQIDQSLLSPPLDKHRAHREARRASSNEKKYSSSSDSSEQSEDDESAAVSSEDDPSYYPPGPSYTTSFRPFAYPSATRFIRIPSHSQGGLRPPAPPLFRPKTFWRHTRRSALTGPSYSPSSYIVRRSTFIAAGLSLDSPHADLSALGVELRTGTISLIPSTALPL